MRVDLSGKTALVTGSTAGIGFGAAMGLARAGARVVVNGRDPEGVDAAVRRIAEAAGAEVSGVACDLSGAEGAEALLDRAPEIDILVNSLGMFDMRSFSEIDDATWERMFQTNVMSGIRLSRAILPALMAQGWGRIVFLSSESAFNIQPDLVHYCMTKAAILPVSRGLAKIAAGSGVTVNAVMPGPTLTERMEGVIGDFVEREGVPPAEAGARYVASTRPSSILGRPIAVEEVANMIVYACSKEASATTGAVLRVDGGVVDSIVP